MEGPIGLRVPFVDGNKSTGLVVGILFLELNGPTFAASEADAAQAVFGLAAGEITDDGFGTVFGDRFKRSGNGQC